MPQNDQCYCFTSDYVLYIQLFFIADTKSYIKKIQIELEFTDEIFWYICFEIWSITEEKHTQYMQSAHQHIVQ